MKLSMRVLTTAVIAFWMVCTLPAAAQADVKGRSLLVERIESALRRTLTAQEAEAVRAVANESLEQFRLEQEKMVQAIHAATGLQSEAISGVLSPVGTIRYDADPRVIQQLSVALNRPLSATEKHDVLAADREHTHAFLRLRRAYLERLRVLTDINYQRLDQLLPEIAA